MPAPPAPEYQPLSRGNPGWGNVAVLPWDSDVFGFAVADWKGGAPEEIRLTLPAFSECLAEWASAHEVELIGCAVDANELQWRVILPASGFAFIDFTLDGTLRKVQGLEVRRRHQPVRLATSADQESVVAISENAFRNGRYHADPLFPRGLANARFRQWISDAFTSLSAANRIYVTGPEGAATTFIHVTVAGDGACMTIGGAAASAQGTVIPAAAWSGTLAALKADGIRRVTSKLSASNTAMMNLYAWAGWHFSNPRHIFHWHAPEATNLLRGLSARHVLPHSL